MVTCDSDIIARCSGLHVGNAINATPDAEQQKKVRHVLNPWTGAPHLPQGLACRGGMSEAT